MRRFLILLCSALTLVSAAAAVAASYPSRVDLPDGFRPEGIATGKGRELFVGSIPTGAVHRIDARSGRQRVLVPAQSGRAAIGLEADERDRLFVAGGATGKAFVYDARTGEDLASFQLAPTSATFVNDVVVTRRAAYFTDSRRSVLYVADLGLKGFRELPLPDVPLGAGNNLNGIEAAPDGRTLLAVQSNAGVLWRIDVTSGRAVRVDLGGATLANGDGLLLDGRRTLYVVQNRLNRIAVLRLSRDLRSGRVLRHLRSDEFDVPTTIARVGNRLYLPNARFTTPPQPDTDYWVTQVRR